MTSLRGTNRNRLIGSVALDQHIKDTPVFPLVSLAKASETGQLVGDWVFFGVICQKSEPKSSASGNKYCAFELSVQ